MKKVSELTGAELDCWAAKAEGYNPIWDEDHGHYFVGLKRFGKYSPSTDWAQGGPIIERERIQSRFVRKGYFIGVPFEDKWLCSYPGEPSEIGDTLLIAGMRAYVVRTFGNEVDDSQAHIVQS